MRKAINENPVVQIALVGVLLLVAGFVVSTTVLKKDDGSSATAEPATSAAAPPASPAAATSPSAQPATLPSDAGAVAGVPVLSTDVAPPLPADVAAAYRAGDTIVLLVVRSGGVEDSMMRDAVEKLRGDGRVAVFVTRAEGIYRYVRITQSVAVDRAPALVVVRPRWAGGGTPQATVEYGFRDAQSVVQAVKDAVYQGRTVPYHPG